MPEQPSKKQEQAMEEAVLLTNISSGEHLRAQPHKKQVQVMRLCSRCKQCGGDTAFGRALVHDNQLTLPDDMHPDHNPVDTVHFLLVMHVSVSYFAQFALWSFVVTALLSV